MQDSVENFSKNRGKIIFTMASSSTAPLISFLKSGGLWMDYSDVRYGNLRIIFQIVRICYVVVIFLMQLFKIYSKGMKFLLDGSSTFMPIGILIPTLCISIIVQFPYVRKTIRDFDYTLTRHSTDWEKEILDKEFAKTSAVMKLQIQGLVFFAALYIFGPIFLDILRMFFGYDEPYKVPLPLDGYLEEPLQRNFELYILIIGSHLWFITMVSSFNSFQALILTLVGYAIIELKIIREKVKSLKIINGSWNSSKIKHIVRAHQNIIRIVNDQKLWLGFPSSSAITISTVTTCMVTFLLRQAVKHNDQILIVLCGSFLIMLVSMILLYCFLGQLLETESELLFYDLCDLHWFELSPENRKDYIMILRQARKLLAIDYKGQSPLNLRNFMQFLNTSYSYFMLMKSFDD